MKLLRKILFPIVPIYYIITWLRNTFYDRGWKGSRSYAIPIICVGNLSVGGTGKTPTIEYLIRMLKRDYKLATLSRGYKRETSGFVMADANATAKTIGDEPYQFYRKFNDVMVSVDANRQHGIEQLMKACAPDIILLDDAFQHRKVNAGFNILLTAYRDLYSNDMVLPTGNLREPRSGAKRADIIMVTKCPKGLSATEKEQIKSSLKPLTHQKVYFSSIAYATEVINEDEQLALDALSGRNITLVTGIANPIPMLDFLKSKAIKFEHLQFKDHHAFTDADIAMLQQKELILTTEKDYVRLRDAFAKQKSQLYYLPIAFQIDNAEDFKQTIFSYLSTSLQRP